MIHSITISSFLGTDQPPVLLDVRTPAEYVHGHIPGAFNLPLFSNEERVAVGTTYKQVGREPAILLGFDLTGSKWSGFIREALRLAPSKKVAVHCWRGGMRSGAMAWALNMYGFEVSVIVGGYKAYRRWCISQFSKPYRMLLLGGMTGSGKTRVLQSLAGHEEQVIDLESLAEHQGSVYGSMNRPSQPSQEQFENRLAAALANQNPSKLLWLEDESINIGSCQIPVPFWRQMQQSQVLELKVDYEERVQALTLEYGSLDKTFLSACTEKIHKRLGPEQTKDALKAIAENRMEDFVRILLVYYDKMYKSGLKKRLPDQVIAAFSTNTQELIQQAASINFDKQILQS